ncbi:hypothetical protein AB0M54_16375 [Actinoplanes sp. NPDC051470]|uniref:hypothetical protein n=1 Tax=Actinoplanes sp. NPDC051470 TaxID=3157224 RepID=UPI003434CB62
MELDQVKLEWHDATAETEPASQIPDGEVVLTAGTAVPLKPDARILTDFGGAPNATFGQLIGDNLAANAIHQRMQSIGPTWRSYERFLHYYLTEQSDNFESTGRHLFPDWKTPTSVQARHIIALQPALILLLPLIPGSRQAGLFTSVLDRIEGVTDCGPYVMWAKDAERSGWAAKAQKSLFEQLRAYISVWESWSPGLVVRYTDPANAHKLDLLRVYRDDFEVLRDAYVQIYETCCRTLPFAIALMNAHARGNPNSFGPIPPRILETNARATAPSNISAFEKMPNAHKILWCREWPGWDNNLPEILSNKLRNSIGHASAHYDIVSGVVESDSYSLSYLNFAARFLDLFHPILALLQLLKSTRLIAADAAATG